MNMPGIEFLIDRNGRKKAVLIDLKKHKGLWEDLFDAYIAHQRRGEPNVLSNATHGTLKIDMDELRRVPIPVPSQSEQKRIVQKIDLLSTETQRLKRLYQQKQGALAALKKSLLHRAFSGAL